jgi:hypothetical protein
MGFSSEDVARALRATGNNYEAACALLVGEADVIPLTLSPFSFPLFFLSLPSLLFFLTPSQEDNPLDEDSPIVGAIFSNPVVSAGLSNPRVMQGFIFIYFISLPLFLKVLCYFNLI